MLGVYTLKTAEM